VLKCHRRLYQSGYYANSQRVSTSLNANSQRVGTAIGNSQSVGTAISNSQSVGMAIGNSQSVGTAIGNSQSVGTAVDGNSQDVSMRLTSAEDKPTLDHLHHFGCVVWKHIPKSQRLDAKMGAHAKACMMLGYVHDTTKIWRIWDPDFGKAVNCSDLYFDESQTAHMSCMADNKRSGDPLGLLEEEPVVTKVMKDSPEAENPDTAPEQESNSAAVLDTPAVTPPTRSGTLEEAPTPDPQSEPDGVITAIPSQPRMLTRSQSRREARAGTDLAAEVTTDDDPRSYREAMNGPLQYQWKVAMQQEYVSLLENHTFTPVEHARSKPIGCKWVYKTKTNPDGCHEPGATGSLAPAPVPLSPLSPCGSSSFPLPQPRSSSALRRLDRSPPYRSGSDIPDCWPV